MTDTSLPFVRVADIICATAAVTGCSTHDIRSSRRDRETVIARHMAMSIAREITGRSLTDIARRFGDRDHTTVLSAIATHARRRAESQSLRAQEEAVRLRLQRMSHAAAVAMRGALGEAMPPPEPAPEPPQAPAAPPAAVEVACEQPAPPPIHERPCRSAALACWDKSFRDWCAENDARFKAAFVHALLEAAEERRHAAA